MKRYRHVGAQALVLPDGRRVLGEEFGADFTVSYEAFLLRAGIVTVVVPPVQVEVAEPMAPEPKRKG